MADDVKIEGENAPDAEPVVTAEDAAENDVAVSYINGHKVAKARITYTQDGTDWYIIAKTRVKYGVVRSFGDEEKLPAAFAGVVLEHNLVDLETGEPLPCPLTAERFADIDFTLVRKFVEGYSKAVSGSGNSKAR